MKRFIKTRLRRALVGIPLVVALLAMSVSLSGCKSLFDKQPVSRTLATPAPPAPRVPTGAEKFATASDTLSTSLEAATRAFERGSSDATAIAAVRTFAEQLPGLDKGVRADFAKTRKILTKVKSPDKDAIQAKVERQYAERKAALASKLAAVSSAETTAALKSSIAATADYLDSITPEEPYQPLGTNLPHRIVDAKAGPPVLGARIAPAYAPNTPGAEPSTLPVTPTAADTTQTVEVQFTPEISSLVASLGADPVRMYEYVRNTIDFEPYYGSRKGATETLLEGSGNDIDTASLLIALYRKAGIPARYVSGVVDVPIEKAMNWVGVETPEAAAKLFSAGGTSTKVLISGGRPKALQIEHTWAEVYVDYEDYRGAGAGSGEKVWVPLDGSWKPRTDHAQGPVNSPAVAIGVGALAEALDQATSMPSSNTALFDGPGLTDAAAAATQSAEAIASANATGSTEPAPSLRTDAVLPVATPIGVREVTSEAREISHGAQRSDVLISVTSAGTSLIEVQLADASIGSKRLTLSYDAATSTDEALWTAYGSIQDIPAYLVQTRAVLKLDGVTLAESEQSTPMGRVVNVHVTTEDGVELGSTDVRAGTYSTLVFDMGRVGLEPRLQLVRTLSALYSAASGSTGASVSSDDRDEMLGGLLQHAGMTYFAAVDGASRSLFSASGVTWFRDLSFAHIGIEATPYCVLGIPTKLNPVALFMDVDTLAAVSAQDAVSPQHASALRDLEGAVASACEGRALAEIAGNTGGAGVSAVSAFETAIRSGIPLVTLTSENIADSMPALDLTDGIKEEVRSQVQLGRTVTLPASLVELAGWRGAGYIVRDPVSGDAGYMISGGFAGGWDTAAVVMSVTLTFLNPVGGASMAAAAVGCAGIVAGMYRVQMAYDRLYTAWVESDGSGDGYETVRRRQADVAAYMTIATGALAIYAGLSAASTIGGVVSGAPQWLSLYWGIGACLTGVLMSYMSGIWELAFEADMQDLRRRPART